MVKTNSLLGKPRPKLEKLLKKFGIKKPICFICEKGDFNLYYVGICKECLDNEKGVVRRVKGTRFLKLKKRLECK